MVLGFTKDKKFIPTENRSAVGQKLSSGKLLPKADTPEDEERHTKRLSKFAIRKAKQFGKVTKTTAVKIRNRQISKSIESQTETEVLDREIDDILDDERSSDSSKFRKLQRFGLLQRSRLSKSQLKVVNDSLRELDGRIEPENCNINEYCF